jgi:hypothetical protein
MALGGNPTMGVYPLTLILGRQKKSFIVFGKKLNDQGLR